MRGIDDVLKEGFDRHTRAVERRGGFGAKRGTAAVGAIRRRRVIRGAATGGASVLIAAALAVGAVRLAAADIDPIAPDPIPNSGAYPWCDLDTYPLPNVAGIGTTDYQGRVYADYEANVYVYVSPDGSHQVLEPKEDGSYIAIAPDGAELVAHRPGDLAGVEWRGMAFDYWGTSGSPFSYSFPYLEAPEGPRLGYEWTTTIPDEVPVGVDVEALAQAQAVSLGFFGSGISRQAVPEGALVEAVIRWSDGREEVSEVDLDNFTSSNYASRMGVASISLRVSNLPDGEIFEITSTYDPTKTWAAACNAAPIETPSPTVAMGSYAWCDLSTYPAPNPEAYTEYYGYEGRIYADYESMEFVYVAPDGARQVLEPDADGTYAAIAPDGQRLYAMTPDNGNPVPWTKEALDFWGGGAAGGNPYLESPYGPGLAYEWTTVVPEDAPPGLQVGTLMEVHALSIGFGGTGLTKSAVPDEALVESVIRWTDGREQAVKIGWDEAAASVRDYTGVASISLRVSNLPNGEVFEITSTYDPTKTWAAACGPVPITPPSPGPETPEFNYGPYLEGPEASVFACSRALPPELEDAIPAAVEAHVGEAYWGDEALYVDYGTGGVKITTGHEVGPISGEEWAPQYPGWGSSWSNEDDGTHVGAVTFEALAWIGRDGTIVGREERRLDTSVVVGNSDSYDTGLMGPQGRDWDPAVLVRGNLDSRGLPCDGVDPAALAGATIVYIQGAGPDSEHMTWSWTRIWPAE